MTPCYPRRTTAGRQERKTLHYSSHSSFSSFFLSIHLCKKLSEQESIVCYLFLVMTSTRNTCEGKTLCLYKDASHAVEDIIKHTPNIHISSHAHTRNTSSYSTHIFSILPFYKNTLIFFRA